MRLPAVLLAWAVLALACSRGNAPPLDVADVRVYAPLPGSGMSVAYLTLTNNSDERIVVDSVTSPAFARAEFHESSLDDGVARMREVDALRIEPGRSITLGEGGLHIMLMEPAGEPGLGEPITLVLRYDEAGEIIVRATLESRVRLDID